MPEGRLARDTRLRSLESSGPSLDVRDGVSDFLLAILKKCGQKHKTPKPSMIDILVICPLKSPNIGNQ